MLGGGEFIINGAERVVVSQLHRSPGVDFVMEQEGTTDRKLPSCRIIPERGSWIEINVTKKEALSVRIDQSGKFSAMTLLRAMSPKYSTDADLIRAFYETTVEKIVDGRSVIKIEGKIAVDDVVYPASSERAGEIIVEAGQKITKNAAETICTSGLTKVEVMPAPKSPLIFNSLADDSTVQPRRGVAADLPASAAGQSAAAGKGPDAVSGEVLRRQSLSAGPRRPVPHQSQAEAGRVGKRDDAATRGPDRVDRLPAESAATSADERRSTISITWAIAGCGRSTSWPATNCARAS